MPETRTAYRTCPLCEATCGLEITTSNGDVTAIRGDADDIFSHGFLCPKGVALKGFRKGKVPRPVLEQVYGQRVNAEVAYELPARQPVPCLERDTWNHLVVKLTKRE